MELAVIHALAMVMVSTIHCVEQPARPIEALVVELRVPPAKVSITGVVVRTVSMLIGVFAPTIAAIPHSQRFALMASFGIIGILCGVLLPPPGLYLPTTKKTGKNSVQLIDRQTDQTYIEPVLKPMHNTNYSVCALSFKETHSERKLRVQRVGLNQTRLDAHLYGKLRRMYTQLEKSEVSDTRASGKLDKAWGVESNWFDEF